MMHCSTNIRSLAYTIINFYARSPEGHNQALDFSMAYNYALLETVSAIFTPIVGDIKLPDSDFFNRHVTEKGKKEITDLDETATILFKNILGDALLFTRANNPTFKEDLWEKASQGGNQKWAAEYIQQKALPFIQLTITGLEKKWPGIVKQKAQDGITERARKTLAFFEI
jgi:hypothetical protein